MEKECDGRWTAETIRKTFDYWVGKDSPTAPKAPGKMNGLLLIGPIPQKKAAIVRIWQSALV
jgi:hypothetical protein